MLLLWRRPRRAHLMLLVVHGEQAKTSRRGAIRRRRGSRRGVAHQLGDEETENEAADVGEEGDAAAVTLGRRKEAGIGFDERVQEPRAEEEPRRQPNRDEDNEAEHPRVWK